MAHLTVTVVLLFLASVHAAPAPKEFTLAKNTNLGFGAAGHQSEAHGLVKHSDGTPTKAPADTGNDESVAIVQDVHAGAAFSTHGSVATGIIKNKVTIDPAKTAFGFLGQKWMT